MKDVPSTSHEESDEEKGSIVNRIISVISTHIYSCDSSPNRRWYDQSRIIYSCFI